MKNVPLVAACAFFLIALVMVGGSPAPLYRYEDRENMIIRTNRLTGNQAIRFQDPDAHKGISRMATGQEVNWIPAESYYRWRLERQLENERLRELIARQELQNRLQQFEWNLQRQLDDLEAELRRERLNRMLSDR